MKAWWASLGRAQRVGAVVLALVIAVNVGLAGLGRVLPGSPGGPGSSSFGTGGDGLAAYADLVESAGHDVTRLRSRVGPDDLPAGATAVIADPTDLTASEGAVLGRFVLDGGRVVLSGPDAAPLVEVFTGQAVELESGDAVDEITVWVPTPFTGAATTLSGDGGHRWTETGSLLALAGGGGEPTVLTGAVGDGRVLAVADTGPLLNRHLAQADNAAFGLALVGPDRPVVFLESTHGYATEGFGAIPSSWRWSAAGLAVALVLGLWAAGTRFGPPEPTERALRPPRSDYVEAVAATMARGVETPADLAEALDAPDEPSGAPTLERALAVGATRAEERRRRHTPPEPPDRSDRSDLPGARP